MKFSDKNIHFLNAFAPISVTLSGIVTELKLKQLLNAKSPTVSTPFGIINSSNLLHDSNCLLDISLMLFNPYLEPSNDFKFCLSTKGMLFKSFVAFILTSTTPSEGISSLGTHKFVKPPTVTSAIT